MKYKNIIFDLGGVLLNLDMPLMQTRLGALGADPSLFFVKATKEDNSILCNGFSISKVIKDYQVGLMSSGDLIDLILHQCYNGTTSEEVIDAWNSCLLDIPQERLDLIKQLRNNGYNVYLLSNTNDLHWQWIVKNHFSRVGYTLDSLFDNVFLSHYMNMEKPKLDIYLNVLESIGCKGADCLFIDDSEANVEGALRAGLNAEWLNLDKEDIVTLLERVL